MKKRINNALENIPELECAGIYALTDESGKMYIGRAVNLKRRLREHNRGMSVAMSGQHDAFESLRLQEAVAAGSVFTISILATFPSGIDVPLLETIERAFIAEYAGKSQLYNELIRGQQPRPLRGCRSRAKRGLETE